MAQKMITDLLSPLRTEIVESEKARIDLLKYKLLAIAGLGGAGLGIQGNTFPLSIYLLLVIPFVCNFVDLLCLHNTLRILVISEFFQHYGDPYENFINKIEKDIRQKHPKKKRYIFSLEDWALHWSSLAISILLVGFGLYFFNTECCSLTLKSGSFFLVGIMGCIITLAILNEYNKRRDLLSGSFKKKRGNM